LFPRQRSTHLFLFWKKTERLHGFAPAKTGDPV
jgi:hypothetical protein